MCDYNNDDTVSSGQILCSAAGRGELRVLGNQTPELTGRKPGAAKTGTRNVGRGRESMYVCRGGW